MSITFLIAQVTGIFCLVAGASMLIQKKVFIEVVNDMAKSPAILYTLGFISLLLGLLVVLAHNIWDQGFLPLVITLIGWAMILKGAAGLVIPHTTFEYWVRLLKIEKLSWLYALILLVIGVYLTFAGFMG